MNLNATIQEELDHLDDLRYRIIEQSCTICPKGTPCFRCGFGQMDIAIAAMMQALRDIERKVA